MNDWYVSSLDFAGYARASRARLFINFPLIFMWINNLDVRDPSCPIHHQHKVYSSLLTGGGKTPDYWVKGLLVQNRPQGLGLTT